MNKFKFMVGDNVRCINDYGSGNTLRYGNVYNVIKLINSFCEDMILLDNSPSPISNQIKSGVWRSDRFELITPSNEELIEVPQDDSTKRFSIRITVGEDRSEEFHTEYHSNSVKVGDAQYIINKILEGL